MRHRKERLTEARMAGYYKISDGVLFLYRPLLKGDGNSIRTIRVFQARFKEAMDAMRKDSASMLGTSDVDMGGLTMLRDALYADGQVSLPKEYRGMRGDIDAEIKLRYTIEGFGYRRLTR